MRNENIRNQLDYHLEAVSKNRNRLNPSKEAVYITVWYVILGSLWILFSDSIVNAMFKNPDVVRTIQLLKGWLYVLITGIYIYSLIYIRIKLLKEADDETRENYNNIQILTEELIAKEDEIFNLSHYDRTSGLLNWSGLSDEFENFVALEHVDKLALFYIDIDNIKHVNDTLGHENGNLLLKSIGEKLNRLTEHHGIVSRVSGDEFVVILNCPENVSQIHKRATQINQLLKTTWKFDKYEFVITASIGVALYPEHGNNLENLLKHADLAMFIAKDNGKNGHFLYDPSISLKTKNYVEVVAELRYGLQNKEFALFYQPIVELGTQKIVGVEALIRWKHPNRGLLSPFYFIEIAEESGQINEIGRWVFETACHQQKKWAEQGLNIKMSINISGRRLFDENLIEDIKAVVKKYGINPSIIQIEITETAVMKNLKDAMKILNEIRALGFNIALDDFGTGYSSLTYLQMFPIDVLKIDKEFIKHINIKGDDKENSIINAVINLAHALNLETVAEGIEYNEQGEYLLINGCDYGQGYLYDKPLSLEDFNAKYISQLN